MAPQNLKSKIILSIVAFCSLLIFLDWFVFSFLFLKIPNELEWDTSPWYNFLQKKENLKLEFVQTRDNILAEFQSLKRSYALGDFLDKISPKLDELKEGFYYLCGMYDEKTAEQDRVMEVT